MVDFHACTWPSPELNAKDTSLAEYFDRLNEPQLDNFCSVLSMDGGGQQTPIITFSHFLPLQVCMFIYGPYVCLFGQSLRNL